MKVKLIGYTPNPEATIILATRTCYQSFEKQNEVSDQKLLEHIVKNNESPLEFAVFTFSVSDISRACSHQIVRHRIGSYCLSGDTKVTGYTKFNGNTKLRTLKDLYAWSTNPKYSGKLRLMAIQSVDERGQIVSNKIKTILSTGKQAVYEIKTQHGQKVKATLNHRFLTSKGWRMLKEISVGDSIMCNGVPAYKDKVWLIQTYITENQTMKQTALMAGVSPSTLRYWLLQYNIQKTTDKKQENYRKSRIGCLNPAWKGDTRKSISARLRATRNTVREQCQTCGTLDGKLEGHHIDEDVYNNNPENIEVLCVTCHRGRHSVRTKVTFASRVVSINFVGVEETYDLEMNAPYHNFVANGIVVHNSQKSQRYCGEENFTIVTPPSILKSSREDVYKDTIETIRKAYCRLKKLGVKSEDARYLLPNACTTELVCSYNARSLRNFLKLRLSAKAQWEIRNVALAMYLAVGEIAPTLVGNLGVNNLPPLLSSLEEEESFDPYHPAHH